MAVIYARDLNGNLNPVNTIKLIKHGEGLDYNITEFNQMNNTVIDYLTAADAAYTTDDGGASIIYTENNTSGTIQPSFEDRPEGLVIDSEAGTLYFQNENNGEGWQYNVGNSDFTIYNAIPNSVSQYLIKNSEGKLLKNGRIKPTGKVRMLHFEWDARNSRDLGGWDCDGGTVQYGKLFRGSVVNNDAYQPQNEIIAKRLGIRHQIDFRNDAEASYKTASNFGDDVWYRRITLNNYYKDIIDIAGTDYPNTKEVFRAIFDAVLHNEPLYFNCSLGRDRTGTIAFMILALLGVARRDIEKEYELSSFSSLEEWDNKTLPALRTSLASPIAYLADNFPGDTLRDNVVNWFAEAGFSDDEINAFRRAMINGSPDSVVSEVITTFNITYNLTNCVSNTNATTVSKGENLSITITPFADCTMANLIVTMDGIDITNEVVAGNAIEIINITGNIYIEATAAEAETTYTNLVRTATTVPYGSEILNGCGYINGRYASSTGVDKYSSNSTSDVCVCTGNISVTTTSYYYPTIYIKGITIDLALNSNCRMYFASPDNVVFTVNMFNSDHYILTTLGNQYYKLEPVYDSNGKPTLISEDLMSAGNSSFRISGIGTGETLIVTIDEPIETATNVYSVNYNLKGLKSSNPATKVAENSEYKSTLVFEDGYNSLESITGTVDNVYSTADIYNPETNEIIIDNVSGDIAIAAEATYVAPYKNMIPYAEEENSTNIYNEIGYKQGVRINTIGSLQEAPGYFVTGLIPCRSGDNVYFKNMKLFYGEAGSNWLHRLCFYDKDKQIIPNSFDKGAAPWWKDLVDNNYAVVQDDVIVSITIPDYYDSFVEYVRFGSGYIGQDSVITVNEPI